MNRKELKEYVKQRKQAIYNDDKFKDLSKFCLYDPDYKEKNPTAYIRKYPDSIHPVKISKSFAAYNTNDILCKMQHVAKSLNYIVVPVKVLHWRRRQNLQKQYPHFNASIHSYMMLPQSILNKKESEMLIDYIRNLDWTS